MNTHHVTVWSELSDDPSDQLLGAARQANYDQAKRLVDADVLGTNETLRRVDEWHDHIGLESGEKSEQKYLFAQFSYDR